MHLKRSNVTIVSSNAPQALKPHPWVRQIGAKSASSPPRPKSAPRGSKSTTFARGIIQSFHLPNFLHNPIGDPSVLPIQYPIYLWLQAAAWEAFGIGGWRFVSCTSKQISKFTVQTFLHLFICSFTSSLVHSAILPCISCAPDKCVQLVRQSEKNMTTSATISNKSEKDPPPTSLSLGEWSYR